MTGRRDDNGEVSVQTVTRQDLPPGQVAVAAVELNVVLVFTRDGAGKVVLIEDEAKRRQVFDSEGKQPKDLHVPTGVYGKMLRLAKGELVA